MTQDEFIAREILWSVPKVNHDELYTPENCRKVGEWLQLEVAAFDWSAAWPLMVMPHNATEWEEPLDEYLKKNCEVPELIREALAGEGVVYVPFIDDWLGTHDETAEDIYGPGLYLNWEENNLHRRAIVPWDMENDPTHRDALFAATVDYLKRREG